MTTEELIEKTAKEMLAELNVMLDHNKVQVGVQNGVRKMVAVQLPEDTTDLLDGKLCDFAKAMVLSWYGVGDL